MFEKYLRTEQNPEDIHRFNFKAVINGSYYNIHNLMTRSYYDIRFIIENVDILNNSNYIGITKESLYKQIYIQFQNTLDSESLENLYNNIIENSYSSDMTYVIITPNYIVQSTGVLDSNDNLIYEGDIIEDNTGTHYAVIYDKNSSLKLENIKIPDTFVTFEDVQGIKITGNVFQYIGSVK